MKYQKASVYTNWIRTLNFQWNVRTDNKLCKTKIWTNTTLNQHIAFNNHNPPQLNRYKTSSFTMKCAIYSLSFYQNKLHKFILKAHTSHLRNKDKLHQHESPYINLPIQTRRRSGHYSKWTYRVDTSPQASAVHLSQHLLSAELIEEFDKWPQECEAVLSKSL